MVSTLASLERYARKRESGENRPRSTSYSSRSHSISFRSDGFASDREYGQHASEEGQELSVSRPVGESHEGAVGIAEQVFLLIWSHPPPSDRGWHRSAQRKVGELLAVRRPDGHVVLRHVVRDRRPLASGHIERPHIAIAGVGIVSQHGDARSVGGEARHAVAARRADASDDLALTVEYGHLHELRRRDRNEDSFPVAADIGRSRRDRRFLGETEEHSGGPTLKAGVVVTSTAMMAPFEPR